jgi:hypothetical protein
VRRVDVVEPGCGAPAVKARLKRSASVGLSVRNTAARFAERTSVGGVFQAAVCPCGAAVRVSRFAQSRASARAFGYRKTSRVEWPKAYVVGATLKPGLFCPGAATFLGTKPAWVSRFSTLQSAHAPFGWQSDFLIDVVELAVESTVATGVAAIAVSCAFGDSREAVHPRVPAIEIERIRPSARRMSEKSIERFSIRASVRDSRAELCLSIAR